MRSWSPGYLSGEDLQEGRRDLAAIEHTCKFWQNRYDLAKLQKPADAGFSLIGVNLFTFIL